MEFTLENQDFDYVEVEVVFAGDVVNNKIVVRDLTYDDAVNFQTLIKTEEELLNIDPENYGDEYHLIPIALGTNFGQWTFGEDTFGNKVTIVKTEKLSGKGYNIKTVFVDFTKAKWTLETMGIAYKMRDTRS